MSVRYPVPRGAQPRTGPSALWNTPLTTANSVTGTLARANANDTSVASGTTTVTGSLARTNANDASAATGTTTVLATLARTNANDTSAATGSTTVVGALARTNANDTSAASGSVGGAVSGTLATTNANDTSAASGATTVLGTVARANADDTGAASGSTTVAGTLARANANDTGVASGVAGAVSGSVAVANANDSSTANGSGGNAVTGAGASSPGRDKGPQKRRVAIEARGKVLTFESEEEAAQWLADQLPKEQEKAAQIARRLVKKAQTVSDVNALQQAVYRAEPVATEYPELRGAIKAQQTVLQSDFVAELQRLAYKRAAEIEAEQQRDEAEALEAMTALMELMD